MNIAINLPNYDAAWDIVGGALRYANSAGDIAILVPHAPMARAEDQDPANWDGAIVQKPRSDLDIPQVGVCASHVGPGVNVSIKYGTVMTLAIEQFVAIGLRSFAFYSQDEWRLGWNVFSNRVKKLGVDPVFISAEAPERVLIELRKPCGIVAHHEHLGLQLLHVCRRIGLRVPGDVHVIAIGNSPICLDSTPTLSSISMPRSLVGFRAAELCARMIKGLPVKSIKIPASGLIIRESVQIENDDMRTAAEIAHHLRTNLMYPVQMEDLLRLSNLSRRRLEQIFRSEYGTSPMAFLRDLRFEHAKEMLRTTDAQLKEIADSCGYYDANHLCRMFRERVNMSPMHFRETCREGSDTGHSEQSSTI